VAGREREGAGGLAFRAPYGGGSMGPSLVRQEARRWEGPGAGSPRERWGQAAVRRCGRQGSGGERALTGGVP
jgi:hypothetical protein